MIEISGKDLGIENCDFVARGKTAGDVVESMFDHLEKEHDMHMPEVKETLEMYQGHIEAFDYRRAAVVNAEMPLDEGVKIIIQRLKEKLDLPETPADYRG